jgi:predicted dehydrogenase
MTRLKVGVVGVGALGRHHARIYSQLPHAELVAVADTVAERGRAVAQACGTEWLADHRDLFGRVDAVSIAVPTFAHRSVATQFLERGISVMVEKPLASSLAEAQAIVAAAEASGAVLQVGHVERFNPALQTARRLSGPPKYIRAERVSPYAFRSIDIGVVLDVMIHDIDLVLGLVGSGPSRVEACGVSILGRNEDCAQARFSFADGCIADFTANRVHPVSRRTMQIWSSAGCVTVDFSSREVVCYAPSARLLGGDSPLARAARPGADIEQLKSEIFAGYIDVQRPAVPPGDALTAELQDFVDCVREGRRPLVDGQAALAAMDAADQVLQGIFAHRWNGAAPGPVGPFLNPSIADRRAA